MADRRLQVFHTVAQLLSFTKAAQALHMTQPAVTFQIRQLEEHFDTRLFDRTHNRISLTPAGEEVFKHSGRIFDLYVEMERDVRKLTGDVSGALMLGDSTTVADYLLPGMLGTFKRAFRDVNISLRVANTDQVVAMVEENAIDLGVVEGPVNNKNLVVEVCHVDRLVVVVPPNHELADRPSVAIGEVLAFPFVLREEGSGTRNVIMEYLRDCGAPADALQVVMELGSPESIKGAVESGLGLSILSTITLAKELRTGALVAVPLEPSLERSFSFVHQRQKFRAHATEELLEFARGHLSQLA